MKQALLLVLCILTLCGCTKNGNMDESPPAETFRLEQSCDDLEKCCTDKCGTYCGSQGGLYQDHLVNGQTCACFCAEG